MEYVRVKNGAVEYPAAIFGNGHDSTWDGRSTKTITFLNGCMDFTTAGEIFKDGTAWEIVSEYSVTEIDPETQEQKIVVKRDVYDNSTFNLAGPITDCRDGNGAVGGTIKVKMGEMTDLEKMIEDIYGGVNG